MDIFITLDYEIFFGANQGTIDKTLIYPTQQLIELSKNTTARFTFFIDIGFLIQLEKHAAAFPHLREEYEIVVKQIKELVKEGHDCQLHIHPHWEKAVYTGENWKFDYRFYKLSDFSDDEIVPIFTRYKEKLEVLTQKKVHSFRAGGWCIQPFSKIKTAFEKNEILIDSSVFSGGKHIEQTYAYDFTRCPDKDSWKFSDDVCAEDVQGTFTELKISSFTYRFLFFWKLFVLGNLFPKKHKPIGNGKPMPSSLTRKKLLTQNHLMCASVDGFFSSKMERIVSIQQKKGDKRVVFIGHPKALTHFSLEKLQKFIRRTDNEFHFKTFTEFYDEIS